MGFIVFPKEQAGGGGGGTSEVLSVNGRKGNVFINHRDVGAIANILSSCGGIQVGTIENRPSSANHNVLYIATNILPNGFYRFNENLGDWEQIGGSNSEAEDVIAIDVIFNNNGTSLNSANLQEVIVELNNLIKDNDTAVKLLINSNKGKVQLDVNDTLGYLNSKVDNFTLKIEDGKIVAKTLIGLEASLAELNYSKGLAGNIQAQIDSLSRVGNFTGAVDTKADLNNLTGLSVNDMVIVISDESKDGISTIYMYNGSTWVFSGEFKAEIRDFATNPIELANEVEGILASQYIDNTIARKIDIKNINSTDELDEGINNLYYTEGRVTNNASVRANTLARHGHGNQMVLNEINESTDGRLMFKGRIVEDTGSSGGSVTWNNF